MKITNNSAARQGVETTTGQVRIPPGRTMDLELTEVGLEKASRLPFLGIEGVERPSKQSPTLGDLNGYNERAAGEIAGLNNELSILTEQLEGANSVNESLKSQLTNSAARVSELEGLLTSSDEEKNSLTDQLKTAQKRIAELEKDPDDIDPLADFDLASFTNKHKGGGSYELYDAKGVAVMKSLTKDQIDAFEAMDQDAKIAWIRAAFAQSPQEAE